jgi:hypothetical protein
MTTTTHDTALAVIERHLEHWKGREPEPDGRVGITPDYLTGGIEALQYVALDFRTAPPYTRAPTHDTAADTWNPSVDAFDHRRIGLTFDQGTDRWESDGMYATPLDEAWEFYIAYTGDTITIPYTMPDGSPRTHADVLAILRANGYTGGDDE